MLEAKTVVQKYSCTVRAVSYALQFEKKANEALQKHANWEEYKAHLVEEAVKVRDDLMAKKELQRTKRLQKRLRQMDEDIPPIAYARKARKKASIDYQMIRPNAKAPKLMKGMPNGNEIVLSASPEGEQELLDLINAEREKKGLSILQWDEDLARACRYHACDLATDGYFKHNTHDRKKGTLIEIGSAFDRIKKFYRKSFINTENIAAGNAAPKETYQQWYTSKGHYENMFNASANKVGIGLFYDSNSTYGYYWVFCTAK